MSLVVSATLVFGALCLLVTEESVASAARYLMTDPYDRATRVVMKLRDVRSVDSGAVVILGSSRILRCVEGEAILGRMIANRIGGDPPAVHDLSYESQTLWEMAALADRVRPTHQGVMIIGLNESTLTALPEDLWKILRSPRIAMTSRTMDEEAAALGVGGQRRTGIYLLDNWRFLSLHLPSFIRNAALRTPHADADYLTHPAREVAFPADHWEGEAAWLPELIQDYTANSSSGFEFLGRFVDKIRESGDVEVLLVKTPVNPAWSRYPGGMAFYDRIRSDIQRFADQRDVPFLAIDQEAVFSATDFDDLEGHIGNAEARSRCTETLAAGIAELLAVRRDLVR